MRYFNVTAKCGHVGRGYYIPITFAVKAESAAEAASVARDLPRVKHHHKDAILSVKEVDLYEFEDQSHVNNYDPYLRCSSKKEQWQEYDAICSRIEKETGPEEERNVRSLPEKAVYSGKERIRNVRRFAREQAARYAMLEAI